MILARDPGGLDLLVRELCRREPGLLRLLVAAGCSESRGDRPRQGLEPPGGAGSACFRDGGTGGGPARRPSSGRRGLAVVQGCRARVCRRDSARRRHSSPLGVSKAGRIGRGRGLESRVRPVQPAFATVEEVFGFPDRTGCADRRDATAPAAPTGDPVSATGVGAGAGSHSSAVSADDHCADHNEAQSNRGK